MNKRMHRFWFALLVLGLLASCTAPQPSTTRGVTVVRPGWETETLTPTSPRQATFAAGQTQNARHATTQAWVRTEQVHGKTLTSLALTLSRTTTKSWKQLGSGQYLVYWLESKMAYFVISLDGRENAILVEYSYNDPYAGLSPDGRIIALCGESDINFYDIMNDSLYPANINAGLMEYRAISWSPDGNSLVYSAMPDNGWYPIFVTSLVDGVTDRLTPWDTIEGSPAWSPDGQWIAFASDQAKINGPGSFLGATEIYLMRTGCLEYPKTCIEDLILLTNMGLNGTSSDPAWPPDSKKIIFSCTPNDIFQDDICMINSDGSNLINLTNTTAVNEYLPAWSPDGKFIAFSCGEFYQPSDICVLPSEGGEVINITNTTNIAEDFIFWMTIE